MIDSAALMAPASPPETGASISRKPRSAACAARAVVTSGRMLEKSIISAPACVVEYSVLAGEHGLHVG